VKLYELEQEVRNFAPCGGLAAWKFRLRCEFVRDEARFALTAEVPDRETARPKIIRMMVTRSISELGLLPGLAARELIRSLIHDFVAHEADESISFEVARPSPPALWFRPGGFVDPLATAIPIPTYERPFDPHKGETR
jgi:hypothetical protein